MLLLTKSVESSGCKVLNLALLSGETCLLLFESTSCRKSSRLILIDFNANFSYVGSLFFRKGLALICCLNEIDEKALA